MHLAPNIHVARIDRRSVVLDLENDRYVGLNADLSDALERLSSFSGENSHMTPDDRALAKLWQQGIVTSESKTHSLSDITRVTAQARTQLPTASLWALLADERPSDEAISFSGMLSAVISLTAVASSLRARSFKSTIDWLSKSKVTAPRRSNNLSIETLASAQTLVNAFDDVRPFFPLKPICRLDAPSLYLHLRRNGQEAQLIFGVRLDPFLAHCWVQIGEVAIREAWDRVRQYTPLLVV